jgi:hypothetical protein
VHFGDHSVGALVAQRPLDDRNEVLELDRDAEDTEKWANVIKSAGIKAN